MYFIWGASGIDTSTSKRWDPLEFGDLIWDEEFNLAPEANQQRILDICTDLHSSPLVLNEQVTCFMEDFKTYVEGEG